MDRPSLLVVAELAAAQVREARGARAPLDARALETLWQRVHSLHVSIAALYAPPVIALPVEGGNVVALDSYRSRPHVAS